MHKIALTTLAAVGIAAAAHAQPSPPSGYPQSGYGQPSGYGQSAGPYDGAPSQGQGGYAPQDQGSYGQGATQGAGQAPPDLRRVLRLRPDQLAAYRTYQTQIAPDPAELQRQRADAERMASAPTPQRLDMIARQLQRDQTDFARRADTVRRFYATLTPQQQRAFDVATAPPSEQGGGQEQGGYGAPAQGGQPQGGAYPGGYGQGAPANGYGDQQRGGYPAPGDGR